MRRIALGGLVFAVSLTLCAGGQARRTATAISLTAKTSNKPFDGFTWATYGRSAQLTGAVADGQPGTAVQLEASVFPFTAGYSVVGATVTGSGGTFSFTATPTVATRYQVVLVADPTSQSPVVPVYVTAKWTNASRGGCGAGSSCRRHFAADIVYPAATVRRERGKRAYFYFAVRYGSRTIPPSRIRLVKTGRQRHIGGTRYRTGFTVSFSTPTAYHYDWLICTKDTEAADGLGLPGHHHCGDRSLSHAVLVKGWIG
jgi:hypothetical protein